MPEKTCSTCQCNKVCDHNKYGFENCGNYISDDLLPRAREIFEEIEKIICANTYPDFDANHKPVNIWNACSGYDAIDELKKKYREEGK